MFRELGGCAKFVRLETTDFNLIEFFEILVKAEINKFRCSYKFGRRMLESH